MIPTELMTHDYNTVRKRNILLYSPPAVIVGCVATPIAVPVTNSKGYKYTYSIIV